MKKNVALVLSSGGARGIAQIGAINELKRTGFEITSISGSSIGSLIGGIYAMGKLDEFTAWVNTLNRIDIFNIMDFTISTHGILKVEKLFRIMEKDFPDMQIEDLKIPYVAMATDVTNNKEVAFTNGSLYKAIRASIALPAIITSVHDEDRILVDGGVLNPIPIRQIQRIDNDILVVVNLYDTDHEDYSENIDIENILTQNQLSDDILSKSTNKKDNVYKSKRKISLIQNIYPKSHNYVTIINKVVTMALQTNAFSSIELYKPDIIINVPRSSAGTFDFHKSEELIKIGQLAAMKSIDKYNERYNLHYGKN
jgi:NTE family protein